MQSYQRLNTISGTLTDSCIDNQTFDPSKSIKGNNSASTAMSDYVEELEIARNASNEE